jgi:cytidylate kinase
MPIITISRGSMSGGRALAECVSSALGAACVGREIVVAAAHKIGISDEVLGRKLDSSPGLWDRLTQERRTYVVAVQAALAERAVDGNLVYHGHAGHLLLRGLPAVLRVRLIAPMAMRVHAVMERDRLRPEAAEEYIRQVDEDRVRWTKFIYGVDLRDPQLYDLVLSLEVMSLRSACALVVEAAGRPEYTVTDEIRGQLANFALASRVKLALAIHPACRGLALEVEAEGGLVTVTGDAPQAVMLTHTSVRVGQEIERAARAVEGVTEVDLKVRPFER